MSSIFFIIQEAMVPNINSLSNLDDLKKVKNKQARKGVESFRAISIIEVFSLLLQAVKGT